LAGGWLAKVISPHDKAPDASALPRVRADPRLAAGMGVRTRKADWKSALRSADFQSALGAGTNGFTPANFLIVISAGEHELARTTSKQRRAAKTAFNT